MTKTKEQWKPIPGFAGDYSVSNLGRIKAHARMRPVLGGLKRPIPSRLLKPRLSCGKYYVTIRQNNNPKRLCVDDLVQELFPNT